MTLSHQHYLKLIKNKLGADFVAWETYKDTIKLKVKRGKTTDYFELNGTLETVTDATYLQLLQELNYES